MRDALSKLKPTFGNFLHQIAPSVIATLIAAGLISGYNRAFSGHLQQPRMAALHAAAEAEPVEAVAVTATPVSTPAAIPSVATTAPAKPAVPAAEYFAARERAVEPTPARVPEKEASAEAGKDQSVVKVATVTPVVPTPQLAPRPVVVTPRPEPRVASVPPVVTAPPMTAAAPLPAPIVAAPAVQPMPPPVIVAQPQPMMQPQADAAQPMVTVPDRPGTQPVYEAEETPAPAPAQGPLGAIVNTLRPSAIFARAREFGQRIEAAGNDILPNIRQ